MRRRYITDSEVREIYDQYHMGSRTKARTLPMYFIIEWAVSRPDILVTDTEGNISLKDQSCYNK